MRINIRGTEKNIEMADKNLSSISKSNKESRWKSLAREINESIREDL